MPYRVAALAGVATVYDSDDYPICTTSGCGKPGPKAVAKAHMIASSLNAAPALLQALESVVALIGDDATLGESDCVNAARAAIAKTKGGDNS